MKGLKVILAAWSCFLSCMQLRAEHQVSLQGIVNISGHQLAFLQIDHETSAVRVGEQIEGGSRGNNFEAEVLNIDMANEVVITRIAGDFYTNSLPTPNHPASAKSWIHLKDASFKEAMELYGVLTERTILLHPAVNTDSFSCDASWSEDSPSKASITACFTQALEQRGIVSREDGTYFIQIVPSSMPQTLSLSAPEQPAETNKIPPGLIDFEGVPLTEALSIYGKLIGKHQKSDGNSTAGFRSYTPIYFKSTCRLPKPEVIYAFETLFRWHGVKIVSYDDNTFGVANVSQ